MANAQIPMQNIGPLLMQGSIVNEAVMVPLATFESPLWPSTNRGAKVSRLAGGVKVEIIKEQMTRSVLLEADNLSYILAAMNSFEQSFSLLQEVVSKSSRYAKLQSWHMEPLGNLLFIRMGFATSLASGHNMVTHAADEILRWILTKFASLKYVSISGNYCVDKKVSAVNALLGRGKHCLAEIVIPNHICQEVLKTSAEKIHQLNIKKNLVGSILAGSLRSANAHYANMLLAFYLAMGQDAANIVEASQGITYTNVQDDALYFSVSLPNIIVGTIGNGKEQPFVQHNLQQLGCLGDEGSRRLAAICAATVLCGELSLLAAQTNQGELMRSHLTMERKQ